jgi:hypothetical protein
MFRYTQNSNISENSKPGKSQGRKATGLRHFRYDRRATEEVTDFRTVYQFGTQFLLCYRKEMKMKKWLSLLLTVILVLSAVMVPAAARGNSGKSSPASAAAKAETSDTDPASETASGKTAKTPNEKPKRTETKTVFKAELNVQKKELQQQKTTLNQQKEALQVQYEAMLASGDTAGAALIMERVQELNQQIQTLRTQIKEIINERFMAAKTLYTDEELAQFSSASDLIAQMYADAEILQAGSVTVNNQIVKFDTPAYIKNGTVLVPLRAVAEKLGGEVTWNNETHTVTITKDNTVIEIAPGSITAQVDGVPVEMNLPAAVTCGRTYVPLRFLTEALGLETELDSDNDTVDIEDGGTDADSADTSAEDAAADTGTADSTNPDTAATDAVQG